MTFIGIPLIADLPDQITGLHPSATERVHEEPGADGGVAGGRLAWVGTW